MITRRDVLGWLAAIPVVGTVGELNPTLPNVIWTKTHPAFLGSIAIRFPDGVAAIWKNSIRDAERAIVQAKDIANIEEAEAIFGRPLCSGLSSSNWHPHDSYVTGIIS